MNEWTESEILIQLAGHLRGRALMEWNLLEDRDKQHWKCAVKTLQNRLEHGNSAAAALEFRHLYQHKMETVSQFVSRLEKTFRTAHGKSKMPMESREALLHGQLQDGLLYKLMVSPAVSGAQDYKILCTAAKNEERRLAELSRREQYHHFQREYDPRGASQAPSRTLRQDSSHIEVFRACYNCGSKDHLAKNCRAAKTESSGQSNATSRNQPIILSHEGHL